MKQAWRLLDEFLPAAEPGNEQEAIQWVLDTLPELGLANLAADRLMLDLTETIRSYGNKPRPGAGFSVLPGLGSCRPERACRGRTGLGLLPRDRACAPG